MWSQWKSVKMFAFGPLFCSQTIIKTSNYDATYDRNILIQLIKGHFCFCPTISTPEDLNSMNDFISWIRGEVPKLPTQRFCAGCSPLPVFIRALRINAIMVLQVLQKIHRFGGFQLFNFLSFFLFCIEMDMKVCNGRHTYYISI